MLQKIHFEVHIILHKLSDRAAGGGGCGCGGVFSSDCTDGCTVLMCLCMLFIESAPYDNLTWHSLHSILLRFLPSLIFSPIKYVVSIATCGGCSPSPSCTVRTQTPLHIM